jgi:hypothetical protein
MHLLELEAWVTRVSLESLVCGPCALLDLKRELFERPSKTLRGVGDHDSP